MAVVHLGVLRMGLRIPGARSLKDRRQALRSLRDRVRHRFEVTWAEVDDTDRPDSRAVICTTAGNDPRLIRSILDRIVGFVESSGKAWPAEVDVEVFQWHPPARTWQVEDVDG